MIQSKAAVLHEMGISRPYNKTKPLTIEDVEIDDPGYNEVLVKIKAADLCHSDLSVIDENRPRPLPMVLGHESAGEVAKLGSCVPDRDIPNYLELYTAGRLPVEQLISHNFFLLIMYISNSCMKTDKRG